MFDIFLTCNLYVQQYFSICDHTVCYLKNFKKIDPLSNGELIGVSFFIWLTVWSQIAIHCGGSKLRIIKKKKKNLARSNPKSLQNWKVYTTCEKITISEFLLSNFVTFLICTYKLISVPTFHMFRKLILDLYYNFNWSWFIVLSIKK